MEKNVSAMQRLMPLLLATCLAIFMENSFLHSWYHHLRDLQFGFFFEGLMFKKSIYLWVNEGLMAVFFFYVALEIRHEVKWGVLRETQEALLPIVGALGGVVMPVLLYKIMVYPYPELWAGWAIPAATDIAFTIAIFDWLCGGSLSQARIILMAIAVVDDLIAISIIALFYGDKFEGIMMMLSLTSVLIMVGMRVLQIRNLAFYVFAAMITWFLVIKSGVHATMAGVVLAFVMPLECSKTSKELIAQLEPLTALIIMPVFAFFNAGVSLIGLSVADFGQPLVMAIAVGLCVGKPTGICGAVYLAERMQWVRMPDSCSWRVMWGVGALAGIGFTMSLFIGTLAFKDPLYESQVRLGIILGSLLSGFASVIVMRGVNRIARGSHSTV